MDYFDSSIKLKNPKAFLLAKVYNPDLHRSYIQMGKPASVVSTLNSRSPHLLYFGQNVAEDACEELGFGDPSRISFLIMMVCQPISGG